MRISTKYPGKKLLKIYAILARWVISGLKGETRLILRN
ncbi:hypothetical protein D515_03008 [Grimontia indica]|uniref:Uncharacterized protein n=1 Tax=Grimontia indica TaxID=1056512 RepID=R1IBT8_9GAMM|nr:hypothetical protein D515_03008 [Grimontia indica]